METLIDNITTHTEQPDILFERLRKAYQEDNLTLFVGAGVSKTVPGSTAMLWKDAVKEMQGILENPWETDPLRLAQLLYQQYPEKYDDLCQRIMGNQEDISDVHRLIAELHPRVIITTNWDCLLEKAMRDNFLWYDKVSCDEELLKSERNHKIIKMHGDFSRKDSRFVFKEDDYLNYSQNFPLIETFVKNTLVTTNVLFIGYSYSDINLKMIMTWLKQNRKTENRPLHVIAQFEEDKAQIRYFQNWGIETYICNDDSKPETDKRLASDSQHRSYRLYNFLSSLQRQVIDVHYLLNKYQPYMALPAVPYSIITANIPRSEIACCRVSRPFLNVRTEKISTSQLPFIQKLTEYSIKQKDSSIPSNETIDENIQKLLDFWRKIGIEAVSTNYLHTATAPKFVYSSDCFSNTEFLEQSEEIADYLSFKKITFDKDYDIKDGYQRIVSKFQKGRIAECLIENFIFQVHRRLKRLCVNQGQIELDYPVKSSEEIVDILPRSLQKSYQLFLDVLNFKDIGTKSQKLYALISEKLKRINDKNNGGFSFNNSDSFLERYELLNYLRFFWLNNLCVDYYTEVKEYVYLSLKYIVCLFIYHDAKVIPLKRFELSALLHFCNDSRVKELLNAKTYYLDGTLKLALSDKDILWLVDDVLPNLLHFHQQPLDVLNGTQWSSRIGYVFDLLALADNLTLDHLKKILDIIIAEDSLYKDPFNILRKVQGYLNSQQILLKDNQVVVHDFSEKLFTKFLPYIQKDHFVAFENETFKIIIEMLIMCSELVPLAIEDAKIKEVINFYLKQSLRQRNEWFQLLIMIPKLCTEEKQQEYLGHILQDFKDNPVDSIEYYIYSCLLVLLGINTDLDVMLKSLKESKQIQLKKTSSSYSSDDDWLRGLLGNIISYKKESLSDEQKEMINQLIQGLAPKRSNPFFR